MHWKNDIRADFPSNLDHDKSMLFGVNNKNGTFQIVNKKYSGLEKTENVVITLYHADTTLSNKVVAQTNCEDNSQRWVFKLR